MESTSIITQVNRDEEQINTFPTSESGPSSSKKPRSRSLLNTFLCCFGSGRHGTHQSVPQTADQTDQREALMFASNKCHLSYKQNYLSKEKSLEHRSAPVNDPSTQPNKYLLPQVRQQDAHKCCIVIDLDETLVHSSFKPISNADFVVPVEIDGTVHEVYVLKRPHVDEFLQKVGQLYECVLFTASLAKYADPVADLLDKWGVFRCRLFRESCVFHRGNYIKDLSRLGRKLERIVIVDNSPASYIFHQDNAIPVSSWFDDMSDTELLDVLPLLERISQEEDVYKILKKENHNHIKR